MLLWLNLVTNGIQDVALAFDQGDSGELRRSPRPQIKVHTFHFFLLVGYSDINMQISHQFLLHQSCIWRRVFETSIHEKMSPKIRWEGHRPVVVE